MQLGLGRKLRFCLLYKKLSFFKLQVQHYLYGHVFHQGRLLLGRLHWRVLLRDGLIGLPGKRRWTKVGSILGFVSLSFSERPPKGDLCLVGGLQCQLWRPQEQILQCWTNGGQRHVQRGSKKCVRVYNLYFPLELNLHTWVVLLRGTISRSCLLHK